MFPKIKENLEISEGFDFEISPITYDKDFLFKGIHIGYANFLFEENTKISYANNTEAIKMHFVLSGNTMMRSEIQTHQFESYHHNLIYSPKSKTSWEWEANNELQLFEVSLKIDFLKKYVSKKDPYISLFIDAIEKKSLAAYSTKT